MYAWIYKTEIMAKIISRRIDKFQFDAQEILPGIYLGSYNAASNKEKLSIYGITHILTVAIDAQPLYTDDFHYMVIRAYDHEFQDLISYFDVANNFIKNALKNDGVVLIHCMAGISRSATILIAYILQSQQQQIQSQQQLNAVEDTITLIKEKRSIIRPNPGFREQLHLYEKVLRERREVLSHEIKKYNQKAELQLCLPLKQKEIIFEKYNINNNKNNNNNIKNNNINLWIGSCTNDLSHFGTYLEEMQPIKIERTFQQIIFDFCFRFIRGWLLYFAKFL